MKSIYTLLLIIFSTQCFGQTDRNGNPVFNSIALKEETEKDFQLSFNYYTLKNNIENPLSSVFVSKSPTINETEYAAINLPSDFFIILKNGVVVNLILLRNQPSMQFLVVNPNNGKQDVFPVTLEGDLTENRAREIVSEKFDPNGRIDGDRLSFNNKTLKIISNAAIRKQVLKLIQAEKLAETEPSNVRILSQSEQRAFILSESKPGGKLDFFSEIKGHEYDGVLIKPGVFATKMHVAMYKWGQANFELGVNTVKDAIGYWAEIQGRKANDREIDYITDGFNNRFEK